MKPTKPIKSKLFLDRLIIDTIFGIQCGYYYLKSKNELLEFINEKKINSYSIVKIEDMYLFILKIQKDEVFISTINGNINCISDIIKN